MSNAGESSPSIAVSRHAVVAEIFELLAHNLGPFIDERMAIHFEDEPSWAEAAANRLGRPAEHGATDPFFQLLVLRRFWGPVFAEFYQHDLRSLIGELIEVRNQWAHFRLPPDIAVLERSALAVERLLAPVSPHAASDLRRLRSRLTVDFDGNSTDGEESTLPLPSEVDVDHLAAQLTETEAVFTELQERYGNLEAELSTSRRIAADKQLRLTALEHRLVEIESRSEAAEAFLAEERYTRNRIEWLFVGLLASLLLFMILANS